MVLSFKKQNNPSDVSADVIDNHLILSLPNALEPIVWRMAMDKIGTAAFEIKQDAKSEKAGLILKPKKGTAEIIASFANKDGALEALIAASEAMHSGSASTAPSKQKKQKTSPKKKTIQSGNNSQRWVIAILGAVIVIGLYAYLTTLIPNRLESSTLENQAAFATGAPQETTGVPVSADDFLGSFQ